MNILSLRHLSSQSPYEEESECKMDHLVNGVNTNVHSKITWVLNQTILWKEVFRFILTEHGVKLVSVLVYTVL